METIIHQLGLILITKLKMKEIVISNLMRAKNKQSFFALHQIQSKIKTLYPDIRIEFHILWDNIAEGDLGDNEKWATLIDSEIENVYSYSKDFFDNYVQEFYGIEDIGRFRVWKAIYFVIMAHYLRRVMLKHYYLIYDDDILINDDFKLITDKVLERVPVMITEPLNSNCDKVLFNRLVQVFGEDFYHKYVKRNPTMQGFNAGFQGIDLSIYDYFLSKDVFSLMLNLFDCKSVLDSEGKEFFGPERFLIDTQQQSFFGLMNTVLSKQDPYILDPEEYFVIPTFGHHPKYGELGLDNELGEWGPALQSKVTHFIGHTQGKGKPKEFLEKVDEYLKLNNYI
jgi:hypothetical protein